jgi:hypothetical protein
VKVHAAPHEGTDPPSADELAALLAPGFRHETSRPAELGGRPARLDAFRRVA